MKYWFFCLNKRNLFILLLVKYMKKNSIWLENLKESTQKQIDKDIEVDVLIVGGGITGLTTAYFLKDKNFSICLVDQDKV